MITLMALSFTLALANPFGGVVDLRAVMILTLWIAGFLCLLNIALAVFYRKRQRKEVVSYFVACGIELLVFVFALLFTLGVITRTQIPYPLPTTAPINRAEILAALAIGLGLFPAAYWHRINLAELPNRIAEDGKNMKNRDGGVHVNKTPGEWLN